MPGPHDVGLFGEIKGFRSYYIVKTGPVSATSITVCDDQAGAEASNEIARNYIATNLGHLSVSAPEVHVCESEPMTRSPGAMWPFSGRTT